MKKEAPILDSFSECTYQMARVNFFCLEKKMNQRFWQFFFFSSPKIFEFSLSLKVDFSTIFEHTLVEITGFFGCILYFNTRNFSALLHCRTTLLFVIKAHCSTEYLIIKATMSYVQSIKTGVKKEHNGKIIFIFAGYGRKFQNNEQAKTSHEIFFSIWFLSRFPINFCGFKSTVGSLF